MLYYGDVPKGVSEKCLGSGRSLGAREIPFTRMLNCSSRRHVNHFLRYSSGSYIIGRSSDHQRARFSRITSVRQLSRAWKRTATAEQMLHGVTLAWKLESGMCPVLLAVTKIFSHLKEPDSLMKNSMVPSMDRIIIFLSCQMQRLQLFDQRTIHKFADILRFTTIISQNH